MDRAVVSKAQRQISKNNIEVCDGVQDLGNTDLYGKFDGTDFGAIAENGTICGALGQVDGESDYGQLARNQFGGFYY